jgi:F-type H+-transporting ATPase subunit gamma
MAKTQDLKRRIRSVRNTMQLTKAMKMVAAAKLRRAQERIISARPYAHGLLRALRSLAARTEPESHPLLEAHGDRKVELIVITSDKGLCGGFNAGVLRTAIAFAAQQHECEIKINAVGTKGRDYLRSRHELVDHRVDVFRTVNAETARGIAEPVIERYVGQATDRTFLVYNEFKSAIQAAPVVQQLLPIEPIEFTAEDLQGDYIYEPSKDTLLAALLPHYVESQILNALLESTAAEHAARMAAMDSATKNAGELIDGLILKMNRVRQASITTEIIEVVSGAEALG